MLLLTLNPVFLLYNKFLHLNFSATKCEYARKIARSYYRWAQMNVCLDDVSNRQKATITRKYENVINYMWAHKLCEDETPDKPE